MHLAFSPEEDVYRAEIKRYLAEKLPPGWQHFLDTDESLEYTKQFCRELGEKGWLTLSWPKEYGGAGQDLWLQTVFREEMWAAGEPRGPQYMSLNYIGPSIARFGSEEQKEHFLPLIAKGEILFCQGFSEPDAGTDLASLKTRAVRDGDEYVINGEKIWTSYAKKAQYCYLLARTDPDAPKHKGISLFVIPMATPGIDVRPIRSMKGWGNIHSVFFEDVRVPVSTRLGEEHRGWYVAAQALNSERVGIARWEDTRRQLEYLVERVKLALPDGSVLAQEPWVREKLAELEVAYRAARILNYRVIWQTEQGEDPSWEASLARLHSVLGNQKVAQTAMEVLGHFGVSKEDAGWPNARRWEMAWRQQIPATIASGAYEVQKNLIAQRGLGMPRD